MCDKYSCSSSSKIDHKWRQMRDNNISQLRIIRMSVPDLFVG